MAACAPDLVKKVLANCYRSLNRSVIWDNSSGNWHSCLKDRDCSQICPRELVCEAITIGICVCAESLARLNTVVLIQGRIGELSQRNRIPRLVPGPDHEIRRVLSTVGKYASTRQALYLRCIPEAIWLAN